MAETLGVLASGIAFGQLAAGIIKGIQNIRSVWSEFRDAPQNIENILEELEVLCQSLLILRHNVQSRPCDVDLTTSLERVLGITEKTASDLSNIATRLSTDHQQSKSRQYMKRWQVVIKKGEIESIHDKLQRAVRYLNLAVNGYSMSIQFQQFDCTRQLSSRVSLLVSNEGRNSGLTKQLAPQPSTLLLSENETCGGQLTEKALRTTQRSVRRKITQKSVDLFGFGTFIYSYTTEAASWKQSKSAGEASTCATHEEWRFLPSTWTKMNAFNVLRSRSLGNWRYSFKSFYVLDWMSSPILIACKAGNINQVVELLTTGAATMSDITQDGLSLLHTTSYYNRPELCKWLIAHGADVDSRDHAGRTPLDYSWEPFDDGECLDTMRVLLDDEIPGMMFDDDLTNLRTSFIDCSAPPEGFSYLLTFMQKGDDPDSMYTEAWQDGLCKGKYPTMHARAAFCRMPIWPKRATAVSIHSRTGRSLLHALAVNLLLSFDLDLDKSDVMAILKQVLTHRPYLHPYDAYGATPFDYLLGAYNDLWGCEVSTSENMWRLKDTSTRTASS
ncbi:hypothetical protein GGR57DRAFT_469792 [Xylariaceae sp. FL1272]|nr:hypothetical protein GGR57DRAFT_469792 [Xylariaceae sp. FL1272]